ncbi:MAG: hypothetical protein Q9198_002731 [Flavoplaca austrocitrina]
MTVWKPWNHRRRERKLWTPASPNVIDRTLRPSDAGVAPPDKVMLLPSEILLEIFGYLEKLDLKAVRLTSRACSQYANRFLFDVVYISAFKTDYEVFINLAEHLELSTCVKNLKYDASQFPDITKRYYLWYTAEQLMRMNNMSYENAPLDSPDPEINDLVRVVTNRQAGWSARANEHEAWRRFASSRFIEEGYQKWVEHVERQRTMLHGYWINIARKLASFNNLRSFEMYAEWDMQGWYPIDTLKLPTYGDHHLPGSPLLRSWNVAHLRPTGWSFQTQWLSQPITSDGILESYIMNYLLGSIPNRAKSLLVEMAELPTHALTASDPTCSYLIEGNFWPYTCLQHLHLRIGYCDSLDEDPHYNPIDGLSRLLNSTSGLKSLNLELPSDNGLLHHRYTLQEVFGTNSVFESLHSLSLSHVSTDVNSWITLLIFRMKNLQHLDIREIELRQGVWEEVIECMHLYMSLRSVSFPYRRDSMLYPHRKIFWTKNQRLIDAADLWEYTNEHKDFIADIEDYVVHGGRHPCLDFEQPENVFVEASKKLYSSAMEAYQKRAFAKLDAD